MNRLLLFLVCLLCACQTHRMRHTSRRDSSSIHSSTAVTHLEKAVTQSFHEQQLQWSAGSTAVVILPKGVISYHPSQGFKGEATAILSYRSKKAHTATTSDQTIDQQATQSSMKSGASATQIDVKAAGLESERKPVRVFSFWWLGVTLVVCGLVVFLRWFYR
ncbi:hypothetical protein G5B30_04840 [Sphingobacterium sp. SGG-5]|uniref:hypothetical protein n=1 Tax=Sphingobacterium sp. SGG-5 TaxID=2710881 RepID=UPI0013EDFD6D|nr:hypothetical protein [Sphingobacterium sp. SGG-5]NGM61242.1 hypothetical protein [Sphingobacterium sp. SGG-5]